MRLQKTNKLANGNLLFAYHANNAGRGSDNCTLQVVKSGTERKAMSSQNKYVIARALTGSWRGDVNMSKEVLSCLGISKSDIIA